MRVLIDVPVIGAVGTLLLQMAFVLSCCQTTTTVHGLAPFVVNEGWRIALNIGREKITRMPSAWAESRCHLPTVVKAEFKKEGSAFMPKTAAVKFTGPDGQVVKRIEAGTWKLSANEQDLSFSLTFPKELVRRDVTLRGTVRCTGTVYSTASIRAMNEE